MIIVHRIVAHREEMPVARQLMVRLREIKGVPFMAVVQTRSEPGGVIWSAVQRG